MQLPVLATSGSGWECSPETYGSCMVNLHDPQDEHFVQVMALHKYFLNADFLRDVFMRRIKRDKSASEIDPASSIDDMIAMSLWYSTVYVVIEGWREAKLADPELNELLADELVERLRRFRNQIFTTNARTTIPSYSISWEPAVPMLKRQPTGSSALTQH